MPPTSHLLALAESAAREAGALLLGRFRQPASGVDSKSSATDPVSDADRDAEALLRDRILTARPGDGILGEEEGTGGGSGGLRWVIDPLDGTVNYLYGLPVWSVSVACEDEEGTLVGVVYDPTGDEMFTAARGRGAACNGDRIRVSAVSDTAMSLVATGFSYLPHVRERQALALVHLLPALRDLRRGGSAALDLAAVAAGRVDGFFEIGLAPWDRAAGLLLVREAGGLVGSLPPIGDSADGVVVAGPDLHEKLSALVLEALERSRPQNSLH